MNQRGVGSTRREFVKQSGLVAAGTALVGSMVPHVHAAEDNTLQVALIGCGGRGTGAAANAMAVTGPPVKLVAMADVFEKRLSNSFDTLKSEHADRMDVPQDRKFIGFDAY